MINFLSELIVKCKVCQDESIKYKNMNAHIKQCRNSFIVSECIFKTEEEKRPHATNLSWKDWKVHFKSECDG